MDKGGQSLLSFPVWHGKGQEVNKLKSYAVNQLKVTRNTFRDPIIAAVTVSMIAVLLIFVVWPLLEVVKQSLVDTAGNYSFQAYKNIFTMRETYKAFCNTIMLAVIVGVLATVIGFLFAYCTSHLQIRGKRIFNLMAMMPMVSPPFSVALSIIMLFGSRGLITYNLLGWTNTNIYGLKGLIFVQTISYFLSLFFFWPACCGLLTLLLRTRPVIWVLLNGVHSVRLRFLLSVRGLPMRSCWCLLNRWRILRTLWLSAGISPHWRRRCTCRLSGVMMCRAARRWPLSYWISP